MTQPDDPRRLVGHGLIARGEPIHVEVDGAADTGFDGETVAALLMAREERAFRETRFRGERRGLYCGMGVCFDCLVTINGRENIRACMTSLTPGMVITTLPKAAPR